MKKAFLLVAMFLAITTMGWAGACTTGTLQDYINLGATGCTIGNELFSNFAFTSSVSGSAVVPPASGIGVTPLNTPNDPGLFVDIVINAPAGSLGDVAFSYTVTALSGSITDTSLAMTSFVMPDGSVTIAQTECLGDTFADGCAHGTLASLHTWDFGSGSEKLADSNMFAPVGMVDILKDITVSGGTEGFGNVSGEIQHYSTGIVPEPATLSLLGSGLIGLAGLLRKVRS